MITLIFAIDKNGLVGSTKAKNGLPWNIPEDLKFYKDKVRGQNCIMGRKTFESIPGELKYCNPYILTTNKKYNKFNSSRIKVINDINTLDETKDYFICGGVEIYKLFWDKADLILITNINKSYQGDVYFKDYDLSDFNLIESKMSSDKLLTFNKWQRKKKIN